jgi:regulator of sigma D
MACEHLCFQHVSMERQIRELYHYPEERSIQQFFRDSPDLCLSMCIALEEKVKMAVTIFKMAMDRADQCMAEKDKTTQHLFDLIKNKNERIEEKNARIAEKEAMLQQVRNETDTRLEEKDHLIQAITNQFKAEHRVLSTTLERANVETLNLSQSLSVRGMLEKIEHQYSDKRRNGGADVTRRTVWIEILHNNEHLRRALTKHCSERNIESKIDAVATTIVQIYRQVSDEIHHAGYDEIPIQKSKFHGIQLDILRDLCAVTHFAIREV